MISIVDYGSGNIQAIKNICKRLNIECVVAKDAQTILDATKLILPSVGAFDETMQLLSDTGLQDALNIAVLEKKIPIIGICVGMQILAKRSDEGQLAGQVGLMQKLKKLMLRY